MTLKNLTLLLSVGLLSGCLSPVKNNSPSAYVINSVPHEVRTTRSYPAVVLVSAPDARPIYATTRMAYTMHPYQVQYFSENRWAETPSQMLQPLIVQTLQKTKRFRGVMSPPYTGRFSYLLNTRILRFDQDYITQPHAFKLVAQVSLNGFTSSQLIASKEFSISVPLPKESPYGGVLAANMATKRLLNEVAKFVVQNT